MSVTSFAYLRPEIGDGRAALPLPPKTFTQDFRPSDLEDIPELARRHAEHRARQERFNAVPAPKPIVIPEAKPEPRPLVNVKAVIVPLIVTGFWGYNDLPRTAPERPTIRSIQDRVCDVMLIARRDLIGKGRGRTLVFARQVAIWLCKRERPDLTLHTLGKHFGGRDHTTILHALQKIQGLFNRGELELPLGLIRNEVPGQSGRDA